MQSVYDVDVILLLATLMASKRRPAELPEIVAGVELIQGVGLEGLGHRPLVVRFCRSTSGEHHRR